VKRTSPASSRGALFGRTRKVFGGASGGRSGLPGPRVLLADALEHLEGLEVPRVELARRRPQQLEDVRVLLLRHDRAARDGPLARGRGLAEAQVAVLVRGEQQQILRQLAHVHAEEGEHAQHLGLALAARAHGGGRVEHHAAAVIGIHGAVAGGVAAAVLLALHAVTRHDAVLYLLRLGCGMASAASFVGGGLLAARLAQRAPQRSGLLLGVYYGGVGLGIVASALGAPPLLESAGLGWPVAWAALGALALLLTLGTAAGTGSLGAPPAPGAPRAPFSWRPFAFGLAGYGMFGIGYIGNMTFIITLLREQGLGAGTVVAFYVLLGLGVIASSWLWAGLLQRHRSGLPLSLLNGLLALATALPLVGGSTGATCTR
jgi:hypothetical protein